MTTDLLGQINNHSPDHFSADDYVNQLAMRPGNVSIQAIPGVQLFATPCVYVGSGTTRTTCWMIQATGYAADQLYLDMVVGGKEVINGRVLMMIGTVGDPTVSDWSTCNAAGQTAWIRLGGTTSYFTVSADIMGEPTFVLDEATARAAGWSFTAASDVTWARPSPAAAAKSSQITIYIYAGPHRTGPFSFVDIESFNRNTPGYGPIIGKITLDMLPPDNIGTYVSRHLSYR